MLKMLSKIFFGERVAYLLFFLKPGAPTPAELEGDEGELFSRSNPYHCRLHCAKLDDRFHETHHIGANLKVLLSIMPQRHPPHTRLLGI